MTLRLLVALGLAMAIAVHARNARAQAPSDEARARELFEEANREVDGGHLARGRELLLESLALAPRAATAFNLAVVARAMGATLEAEQRLVDLLAGRHGALADDRRRAADTLLREVRAEVAVLSVSVRGAPSATVRVDGRIAGEVDETAPYEVRVDAGPHAVSVEAPDGRTAERSVDLARGDRESVELQLAAAVLASDPDPDERNEGGPSGWVFVGIGLGVLALAGAVVAVVLVTSAGAQPAGDPVWPTGMTLRY